MTLSAFVFTEAWDACYAGARATIQSGSRKVAWHARRSWCDTLAAIAAGVRERCTSAALGASLASGQHELSPADAALVLGTASHALDYDDVCMLATCHPSAPPVAALLALLPMLARSSPTVTWHDILAAYLVGTETTLRLGEWLGFPHYALGFHATSTLGTVGAAAACAHALGLPHAQARRALSIAASSACGLRANFGTDVKPLHVGFAATAALRAALLAKAGADASDDVWGPAGFYRAFNGGQHTPPLQWNPLGPTALEAPGYELKRFPSCYMTHRLIAGVLAIRARQGAHIRDHVHIEIEVAQHGTSALKFPRPASGLQAKFSGQYCAAAAWADGRVALDSFTDAAVARAELQALLQRVQITERADLDERLESAPVHVAVRGQRWIDNITVDWAPGSLDDPMDRAELLAKWGDCAAHGSVDKDDSLVANVLDTPLHTPAADLLIPLRKLLLDSITTR